MRVVLVTFLVAVIAVVSCNHVFMGTNVFRPQVYHHRVEYSSKIFKKRVENLYFVMPSVPTNVGRVIQGIMAYDMKNSEASLNVTQGGIGYNFVNLRMKSERGRGLDYDVYIYA